MTGTGRLKLLKDCSRARRASTSLISIVPGGPRSQTLPCGSPVHMQVDYLQVQRQSVLEPPVQRRSDRYRLPRVDLVERWGCFHPTEQTPSWRRGISPVAVELARDAVLSAQP